MNMPNTQLMYTKRQNFWLALLNQLVLVFLLFVIGMMLIFNIKYASFTVSGTSMLPTILHNDNVYVNRFQDFNVGDIVVIDCKDVQGVSVSNLPEDDYLIKRVIAKEGDCLTMEEETITLPSGEKRKEYSIILNGQKLNEQYILDTSDLKITYQNFESMRQKVKTYNKLQGRTSEDESDTQFTELDKRLASVCTFYERTLILQRGQVFVLGDNRGNSADSSSLGPFDYSNVVGRVEHIVHSTQSTFLYFMKHLFV